MDTELVIDAILEAIKANADASQNATALPSAEPALQHATAAKELAEAIRALGLMVNAGG